MSRHRGLKQIIDDAYDDEPYDEQEEYPEEEELDEESEEILNEVWDTVGDKYDKDAILEALDECDWDPRVAINTLLMESSRFLKKKKAAPSKVETKKPQVDQVKDLPKASKTISQEEKKIDLEKHNSDEFKPFRKHSEDAKVIDTSQFINKSTFNDSIPELVVNQDVMDYLKKSKYFYVVVCGHVDSGKSTLVGHLLYQLGEVDKNTMHKYEKEATQAGKGSFKYAWVLDETAEERERGVTIDVGFKQVQLKDKNVVFMDAPGHREYVPNMIGGTAQADAAILVVDAISGAFDAGFNKGGQTREHAILVRSMGIENIIVCVNKLDVMDWSASRYEYITSLMTPFLEEIGFKDKNIHILPISGLLGDNVQQKSKRPELGWYEGPTLIDIIQNLNASTRSLAKPFRVMINSTYNQTTGKAKGLCIAGKVDSGYIEKGAKCVVMPSCAQITVKDIFVKDEKANFAVSGENAVFVVQAQEFDINSLKNGSVICPKNYPAPVAVKFIAEIEVYDFERPIIRGERTVVHIGSNKISAVITKISHTIKKDTGQIAKKNPKFLSVGEIANVEILCERGTTMELFKNYPLFGRVILREKTTTIAAGVITSILE